MGTVFVVDSRKNGLEGKANSKEAYPLHKQLAENKSNATKYGQNGLTTNNKK